MADNGSDTIPATAPPLEATSARRQHTYSRLTTAIAVLALATAVYSLLRLDSTRDRVESVNDFARKLEADRAALLGDVKNLSARERRSTRDLDSRLDAMEDVPKQLQELILSVEQLRGRAEGPERAWSRSEAMFLLELAQRRLTLDRDVATAIVALESADMRLASLRDSTFAPVRQQIARELQALRSVPQPDVTGVLARLASAEEQALQLPVKGIVTTERKALDRSDLPEGMFARAWGIARRTLSNLIVVRQVDDRAGTIVTSEEALLRRQYLQLLLFSARAAVARHDAPAYRSALATARTALNEFFDLSDASAQALLKEMQALERIDIDPRLPDISGSSQTLQRLSPVRRGPE